MSDGKKAAHEEAQRDEWNRRLRIVMQTSPDELLKIFDDIKIQSDYLNADNLRLTYVEHVRIKALQALIQKLP